MITIIKSLINFSELAAGQMSRLLLLLHLVSFWAPGSMSLKVFSFEKSLEESSGPLSVATLDSKTSEDLPPRFKEEKNEFNFNFSRFVLCWSHKQGAWDQRGVFHMYGINDQPWLTIRYSYSRLKLVMIGSVDMVKFCVGGWVACRINFSFKLCVRLWYWEDKGTVDLWAYFLTAR